MLSAIVMAGSLPLVAISADDARLEKRATFISEDAAEVLYQDAEGEVLCLDRQGNGSICVTRKEWNRTLTLANSRQNLRNMYRILNNGDNR